MSSRKFEDYFSGVYGSRWPELRKHLTLPEKQILRRNLFLGSASSEELEPCGFLENCYWRPADYPVIKNQDGFFEYYAMDPASALVAKAVGAGSGERILDMCAAPGGKSLILAEQMRDGELISNEMSNTRRERLLHVFQDYVPKEQRLFIQVKGLDANQYGLRKPQSFDRVLADVPCSGERHLLANPSEFALWSQRRTENLAVRQYSLLSGAWLSVVEGGRIVYSTCSISPAENDDVVAKLVKKRKPLVLRPSWLESLGFVEKTEHGYQILPDRCGFGPMYFSVLQKI